MDYTVRSDVAGYQPIEMEVSVDDKDVVLGDIFVKSA